MKPQTRLAYLIALASALTLVACAQAAPIADFIDYSLRNSSGQVVLPGRLYIPPEAASEVQPRPLIVFLHGGGASGTNNTTPVAHTPDYLLEEARRRGAFLYVPQTATNWSPSSVVDSVAAMIDRTVAEQNVDARRLYATGFSNGGGGTWNLLSRNPGQFAAAVAVSGVAPAAGFSPANLLGTAILAVHARDDATVRPDRSRNVVRAVLTAAGETPPIFPSQSSLNFLVYNPSIEFHQQLAALIEPGTTINFPISQPDLDLLYFEGVDGGHSGPVGVFYTPVIYDWMFGQALPAPEPSAGALAALGVGGLLLATKRGAPRREVCGG